MAVVVVDHTSVREKDIQNDQGVAAPLVNLIPGNCLSESQRSLPVFPDLAQFLRRIGNVGRIRKRQEGSPVIRRGRSALPSIIKRIGVVGGFAKSRIYIRTFAQGAHNFVHLQLVTGDDQLLVQSQNRRTQIVIDLEPKMIQAPAKRQTNDGYR